MKRTYVLLALVLIAAAVGVKTRILGSHNALDAAKDRIRHIDQQPAAHQAAPKAQKAPPPEERRAASPGQPAEAVRQQVDNPDAAAAASERTMHLVKGTFTQVDGTLVYSADAQLDIGHGMLVSSPTGVMVADEELRHISGDLVVERAGTSATLENAFLTVDGNHVEITSDSSTVVGKEDGKQP